ncbi:MAG TPA: single-stranded DNA-binding protein [Anaerolineae bacterium]|nr:single-stranded DNA-binding protein [Anaerolineae bacterium]
MYQRIIIVGNLGRDPEMRFMPSGQAVTNFSVATNRQYTASNGERVKETSWFRVSVWGKQAENVNKFLHRGSKVLIEGRLSPDPNTGGPRVYQRQDGSYGASFEIRANRVVFLTSRAEDESTQGSYTEDAGEEDIPF